jgi:nitrate/nitrite-specific signal transduction histidine kinase
VTQRRQPSSFEHAEALLDQLRTQLADLRAESRRRTEDVQEVQQLLQASERHAAQLANLYVATYQLHASFELDDVRKAICEIAVNLRGAAQYALLLRDEERNVIEVAARSATVAPAFDSGRYQPGDPMVDASLRDGVVRLSPADGTSVVAAVPLAMHGSVLGCLVIVTLLPQKSSFGSEDRELLDVLAAHAASALLAARLFHERTRKLRTLEGLMQLMRVPAPTEDEP